MYEAIWLYTLRDHTHSIRFDKTPLFRKLCLYLNIAASTLEAQYEIE